MSLENRIALVTGASRGLGKEIASLLAERGARVVLNYAHSARDAENAAREIASRGGQASAERADVRDPASVRVMLDRIASRWGSVEILVNNATGPQPMKPFEQYAWEDFADQLDFFVKAPVLLAQQILPAMKAAGSGRIINIGSEVVKLGNANFSAYVTAKAAMVGLTRSWAREFGPHGITVNLVEPGWIPVERHAGVPPDELTAYCATVPLGRQGIPRDIAETVAFLAGSGGSFITGQRLAVNGGRTF